MLMIHYFTDSTCPMAHPATWHQRYRFSTPIPSSWWGRRSRFGASCRMILTAIACSKRSVAASFCELARNASFATALKRAAQAFLKRWTWSAATRSDFGVQRPYGSAIHFATPAPASPPCFHSKRHVVAPPATTSHLLRGSTVNHFIIYIYYCEGLYLNTSLI